MSKNQESVTSSFPKKWDKFLNPEFKDAADGSSTEDLKKIIVTSEGDLYMINKAKSEDVKLNSAKECAKEFAASYVESSKIATAKINYALYLIEGRGEKVGG